MLDLIIAVVEFECGNPAFKNATASFILGVKDAVLNDFGLQFLLYLLNVGIIKCLTHERLTVLHDRVI